MSGRDTILIVDDEAQIRTLLRTTLVRSGYAVVEAGTAREALNALEIDKPRVVLLDLGLPDRDGLELVTRLQRADTRVIVVSARDDTDQKVAALDLGASDYVTKPFDTEELLARVRAALRQPIPGSPSGSVVAAGEFEIDLTNRIVRRGRDPVHLTPKEYSVLAELAKYAGRVLTHGHLLRTAWGPAHEGQTEYLRVVMRGLRQKLEPEPSSPAYLINEPGVGYRLQVD